MAYFPNGTAADIYSEQYCKRCFHDRNNDCSIILLHMVHNYEECNKEHSFLHALIPRDQNGWNKQCNFFVPKDSMRDASEVHASASGAAHKGVADASRATTMETTPALGFGMPLLVGMVKERMQAGESQEEAIEKVAEHSELRSEAIATLRSALNRTAAL